MAAERATRALQAGNNDDSCCCNIVRTDALVNMEDDMRLDAGVAMLSVGFLLSSVVCSPKARRYRPRPPIRRHRGGRKSRGDGDLFVQRASHWQISQIMRSGQSLEVRLPTAYHFAVLLVLVRQNPTLA
jgi:hypothetical protein